MTDILKFENEYFYLSNFFACTVDYEGLHFCSSEAAYQSMKCANPHDREAFISLNPDDAKTLGRKVGIRTDWDEIKDDIMYDIVREKFEQNPELKEQLISTQDVHLEEGNWWGDTYWGTCEGKGKNHLGEILMRVREELRP